MNDEQIVKDILSTQKSLAKLYMDAILESSCTNMRKTLGDTHMEITEDQYSCFKYMEENNLYPVEYAENQKLTGTIDKFSSL
ncbi:MAG TPA: spore coat protein [Clostridia bacterium]|nr:spore coat protein [Clostridia bacterium]